MVHMSISGYTREFWRLRGEFKLVSMFFENKMIPRYLIGSGSPQEDD